MGLISRSRKTAEPAESVRIADLQSVPAGAEWHAVHVRAGETAELVPSFVWDFAVSCAEFRPLSEHVNRYSAYHQIETVQMRELGSWLPRLCEMRIFVSTRELCEKIAQASGAREPARIGAIGFPTGNQPAMLRRALVSFAENAREHGRELDFIVADNSRDEMRAESKAMLREASRRQGARIFFAGESEKRSFARALSAEAGCDPAIVEFALFDVLNTGFACGANRNALLLHEAGNAFSSVDDDMICRLADAPEPCDGLKFFSTRDVFDRWFYEDRDAALRDAKFVSRDYAELHEELLGKSVADCLAGHSEADLQNANDELLRRVTSERARVVTTFTGHIGDPGIPTSYYYLTYRDKNLARLTESENFYRKALASRNVRAMVSGHAIGDASLSPGLAMGLDARELLPPFIPVLHAEDFVFGAAVWQCCADSVAGHLPCALVHDPASGKAIVAPGDLQGDCRATIWEFAHLLRMLILGWSAPPGEKSTAARMRGLGRHLREIGSAPFADFVEDLCARVLHHESDKLAYLEYVLRLGEDAPEFWQRDVEDYIEQTRAALGAADFDIPFDLKKNHAPQSAREFMRRFIFEFGRLLEVWPDMFEAAQNLRCRGVNLASRVSS